MGLGEEKLKGVLIYCLGAYGGATNARINMENHAC